MPTKKQLSNLVPFSDLTQTQHREIVKKAVEARKSNITLRKNIKLILECASELSAADYAEEFAKIGIIIDKNDTFLELLAKVLNKRMIADPNVRVQDIMNFFKFYAEFTGQTNPEPETRRFIDVPEAREPVIVKFVDDDDDEKQPAN